MLMGSEPLYDASAVRPTEQQRREALKKLRALARPRDLTTEDLYDAMGDVTLWGSDTHEDFGNLRSVSAQIRMLYEEATNRLGAEKGYALAEQVIRTA